MNGLLAYQNIYRFLTKEHAERKEQAKRELWPDETPVTEAEEALSSLEWLRQLASVSGLNVQPAYKQDSLLQPVNPPGEPNQCA